MSIIIWLLNVVNGFLIHTALFLVIGCLVISIFMYRKYPNQTILLNLIGPVLYLVFVAIIPLFTGELLDQVLRLPLVLIFSYLFSIPYVLWGFVILMLCRLWFSEETSGRLIDLFNAAVLISVVILVLLFIYRWTGHNYSLPNILELCFLDMPPIFVFYFIPVFMVVISAALFLIKKILPWHDRALKFLGTAKPFLLLITAAVVLFWIAYAVFNRMNESPEFHYSHEKLKDGKITTPEEYRAVMSAIAASRDQRAMEMISREISNYRKNNADNKPFKTAIALEALGTIPVLGLQKLISISKKKEYHVAKDLGIYVVSSDLAVLAGKAIGCIKNQEDIPVLERLAREGNCHAITALMNMGIKTSFDIDDRRYDACGIDLTLKYLYKIRSDRFDGVLNALIRVLDEQIYLKKDRSRHFGMTTYSNDEILLALFRSADYGIEPGTINCSRCDRAFCELVANRAAPAVMNYIQSGVWAGHRGSNVQAVGLNYAFLILGLTHNAQYASFLNEYVGNQTSLHSYNSDPEVAARIRHYVQAALTGKEWPITFSDIASAALKELKR